MIHRSDKSDHKPQPQLQTHFAVPQPHPPAQYDWLTPGQVLEELNHNEDRWFCITPLGLTGGRYSLMSKQVMWDGCQYLQRLGTGGKWQVVKAELMTYGYNRWQMEVL